MQHPADEKDLDGGGAAPSSWPYSSLLWFGYFGADSRAGRLLVWQSMAALAVIVASSIVLRMATGPTVLGVPLAVWALLIPLGVVAIGWAQARYLASLAELARTLQLQALAFSYGTVMTIAAALFGASLAGEERVSAELFLALLVLAEPIRGVALAHLARRLE